MYGVNVVGSSLEENSEHWRKQPLQRCRRQSELGLTLVRFDFTPSYYHLFAEISATCAYATVHCVENNACELRSPSPLFENV